MLQIQPVEGRRSSVDLCMKDKSIFVNKKLEKNYSFICILSYNMVHENSKEF